MALLHFHYHLFKLIRVSSEFIFVINAMKYLLSTTRVFIHSFLTFYLSCEIDYLKDSSKLFLPLFYPFSSLLSFFYFYLESSRFREQNGEEDYNF